MTVLVIFNLVGWGALFVASLLLPRHVVAGMGEGKCFRAFLWFCIALHVLDMPRELMTGDTKSFLAGALTTFFIFGVMRIGKQIRAQDGVE